MTFNLNLKYESSFWAHNGTVGIVAKSLLRSSSTRATSWADKGVGECSPGEGRWNLVASSGLMASTRQVQYQGGGKGLHRGGASGLSTLRAPQM